MNLASVRGKVLFYDNVSKSLFLGGELQALIILVNNDGAHMILWSLIHQTKVSATRSVSNQMEGSYENSYTNLLNLLTPWCRVLLEKLTGLQLVKKFPAFYGTRRFITALTSVRHLPLSWASPIQSIYPHPTSWRSVLILSTHLILTRTVS